MSATHPTATRATWLAERIELLKAEKELKIGRAHV